MSTDTGISVDQTKSLFKILGQKEAVDILKDLSTADQKKMLIGVMRKAISPIARDAKANLGGYSKRVAASLKTWQPRSSRQSDNPKLMVGVKSNFRGFYDKKDPWFAHMIEYGTEGVKKKGSGRSGPRATDQDESFFRVRSAATKKGARYRMNITARPFFKPAVQMNQGRVQRILIDDISTELLKIVERKKKK